MRRRKFECHAHGALGSEFGERAKLVERPSPVGFHADCTHALRAKFGKEVEIRGVGADLNLRPDNASFGKGDRDAAILERGAQFALQSRIIS